MMSVLAESGQGEGSRQRDAAQIRQLQDELGPAAIAKRLGIAVLGWRFRLA